MRAVLIIFLFLVIFNAEAQLPDCNVGKLTFQVNPSPGLDTIGDLILKRNTSEIYLNLNNFISLNKNFPKKKVRVSGAEICKYKNEKSLLLKPTSKTVTLKYFYKGDTISKQLNVSLQPITKLDFWFGNRRFYSKDTRSEEHTSEL